MKIGMSSYCLDREIEQGCMTLLECIDWAARQGAYCLELVPFAFRFDDPATGKIDASLIKSVRRRAQDAGVELVNYSILADLCREGDALAAEKARIRHEIDIAAELGVPRMRHDVTAFRRPLAQNTLTDFDRWLPVLTDSARELCEYAAARGVMTLIENHGFFANGCDRVERILNGVAHPNYGLLLDTGNIVCVDEDPVAACQALAARTRMVHLKDFYIRSRDPGDSTQFDCGGHWFRSRAGKYLRGAILAQGDLDVYAILGALKKSGYDGCVAVEFEGLEDARYATGVSLANARRIWDEV